MAEKILYQFTLSPYCIKVRRILDYKGLAYRTVEVNPLARGEVVRLSGQRKVPVLVDPDGRGRGTGSRSRNEQGAGGVKGQGCGEQGQGDSPQSGFDRAGESAHGGGQWSSHGGESAPETDRGKGQSREPRIGQESARRNQPAVVADSTAIAEYLEERYPEPPIYPRDPVERARVVLLEDWSDERFAGDLVPFKIFNAGNARRLVDQSRAFYPRRWYHGLLGAVGPAILRRIAAPRRRGRGLVRLREDYERDLDLLEALASRGSYLAGEGPTIADFAVWGMLRTMEGLEGEDLLARRPRLAEWYESMKKL